MKAVRYIVECTTQPGGAFIANLVGECSDEDEAVALATRTFASLLDTDPNVWCRIAVVDVEAGGLYLEPAHLLVNQSPAAPVLSPASASCR